MGRLFLEADSTTCRMPDARRARAVVEKNACRLDELGRLA